MSLWRPRCRAVMREDGLARQDASVQDAMRTQRWLFDTMQDRFPDGSLNVFDRDLRYLYAAGAGLARVGLTPEMLIGRRLDDLFPADSVDPVRPFYARAFAGETVSFALPVFEREYSVRASPLPQPDGAIHAIVALAQETPAQPMTGTIRVLVADGQPVVRLGLRALLASESDLEVVGEAADGLGAVTQARALRPDVLVMGLELPGKGGVQVIRELAARSPAVRALVLTRFADDEHVFSTLRAGAAGYLLKESAPAELLRGIRDVAAGKPLLDPAVVRRIIQELDPAPSAPASDGLTERQQDVLALVTQGLANRVIAARLGLSERTVRTYVSAMLARLGLSSRTEAALYALRSGLGRLED